MGSELGILALYGLVVIVTILIQVLAAQAQVGLMALVKPRDDMPPLTGVAGRMDRCQKNSVVAMALFAPAVLILAVQSAFSPASLLAAQVFLIARVLYVPIYAAGIPWARTLVWVIAFLATARLYHLAM